MVKASRRKIEVLDEVKWLLMKLRIGAHSVTRLVYHFTFIPKYRKRKLIGKIKQRLEGMIKFCAQINDWEVLELSVEPDHVHLLLQANPKDSPSSIMKRIKGGTSKKLREMFPNLAESIWARSFWSSGYFAETIGKKNLEAVAEYISGQKQYHQAKKT